MARIERRRRRRRELPWATASAATASSSPVRGGPEVSSRPATRAAALAAGVAAVGPGEVGRISVGASGLGRDSGESPAAAARRARRLATAPTSWGVVSASASSTTSKMTAVTLSGPPARRARSMSWSPACPGSGTVDRTSAMVSAVTGPLRPSEHSSHRSPGTASRMDSSSWTSPSASPRTRRSTERWGWRRACSRVRRPDSTRYSTKVWSVVTWVSPPSRRR